LNIVLTFVICGLYPTLSGFICGLSYPKGVHYLSNIFNSVQIIVGSYHISIRPGVKDMLHTGVLT
jgi:hypothetical protein